MGVLAAGRKHKRCSVLDTPPGALIPVPVQVASRAKQPRLYPDFSQAGLAQINAVPPPPALPCPLITFTVFQLLESRLRERMGGGMREAGRQSLCLAVGAAQSTPVPVSSHSQGYGPTLWYGSH